MARGARGERREEILTAAGELLASAGMAALSVRTVAEAAGVGMGTLRHYFPTQRDLHRALVLRLVDDRIQDFDIHDTSLAPQARLERCLVQFVPTGQEPRILLEIWFGLYRLGLDPEAPAFAQAFLEVSTTRSRERVREWLQQLADEGHLAAEDVRGHVQRLVALVNGICLELLTPGSGMTGEDAGRLVAEAARATLTAGPAAMAQTTPERGGRDDR